MFMKRGLLAYLTPALALGLAGIAALISIMGMSKLFAGQAEIVMIVMGFIEAGKVVGVSILHNKWKDKSYKLIKWPLLLMVAVAMVITSWGIYGFFTDAYQQTAGELSINQKEIQLVENKQKIFNKNIETLNGQIEFKNNQSQKLIDLRTQQEVRLDSLLSKNHWTNAKRTQEQIDEANRDLKIIQADTDTLYQQVGALQDSVGRLDVEILIMESNSEASAELGPLIYIARVFDTDMDQVINFVMWFIMFVFDPLAIILVIVTNKMWDREDDHDTTKLPTIPHNGWVEVDSEIGKALNDFSRISGNKKPKKERFTLKNDLSRMVKTEEETYDQDPIEEDTLEDIFVVPKEVKLGKYDLKFGPEYTKMMDEMYEEQQEKVEDMVPPPPPPPPIRIIKEGEEPRVPNSFNEDTNEWEPNDSKTKGEELDESWRNILKNRKNKRKGNNNGIVRLGE